MLSQINYQIFTLFGIGKLPAPGTLASLFVIINYYFFFNYNFNIIFIIIIGIILYSLFFLKKTLKKFKNDDPKEIVIDEVAGQLIPLAICEKNIILILFSFICFRFFDIFKIFPANIFDKKIKGPIGIIGDDIIAGIYALLIVYAIKIYL